ncbi:hypothetical protein B0H15DRAFT_994190 [Mycena belliarum]|uniref:Uncharacterized protein n=1 Tax=Mycena belliarum TaxID=1033014 RepID=A0AAD6TYJ9_9AGAR|nr:hypothetical protein B0H15DRAFT_994190 [Mycena belliae]
MLKKKFAPARTLARKEVASRSGREILKDSAPQKDAELLASGRGRQESREYRDSSLEAARPAISAGDWEHKECGAKFRAPQSAQPTCVDQRSAPDWRVRSAPPLRPTSPPSSAPQTTPVGVPHLFDLVRHPCGAQIDIEHKLIVRSGLQAPGNGKDGPSCWWRLLRTESIIICVFEARSMGIYAPRRVGTNETHLTENRGCTRTGPALWNVLGAGAFISRICRAASAQHGALYVGRRSSTAPINLATEGWLEPENVAIRMRFGGRQPWLDVGKKRGRCQAGPKSGAGLEPEAGVNDAIIRPHCHTLASSSRPPCPRGASSSAHTESVHPRSQDSLWTPRALWC